MVGAWGARLALPNPTDPIPSVSSARGQSCILGADPLNDREAAYLPESGEDLFFREHGLEELQVLLDNLIGFVECHKQQGGLANERLGLHFAEIFDDGRPPLVAVSRAANAALAKLIGDVGLQPQRILRGGYWSGGSNRRGGTISSRRGRPFGVSTISQPAGATVWCRRRRDNGPRGQPEDLARSAR